MNAPNYLNWQPVILLKVTRLPVGETHIGLSVKRLYLAQHPDGIGGMATSHILRIAWSSLISDCLARYVCWQA